MISLTRYYRRFQVKGIALGKPMYYALGVKHFSSLEDIVSKLMPDIKKKSFDGSQARNNFKKSFENNAKYEQDIKVIHQSSSNAKISSQTKIAGSINSADKTVNSTNKISPKSGLNNDLDNKIHTPAKSSIGPSNSETKPLSDIFGKNYSDKNTSTFFSNSYGDNNKMDGLAKSNILSSKSLDKNDINNLVNNNNKLTGPSAGKFYDVRTSLNPVTTPLADIFGKQYSDSKKTSALFPNSDDNNHNVKRLATIDNLANKPLAENDMNNLVNNNKDYNNPTVLSANISNNLRTSSSSENKPQRNLTDILGKKSSEIKNNDNSLANKPLAENNMNNLVNNNNNNNLKKNIKDKNGNIKDYNNPTVLSANISINLRTSSISENKSQTNLTDILGKKSSEIKTNGNNLANKPLAENDMSNLVNNNSNNNNINDKNDNNKNYNNPTVLSANISNNLRTSSSFENKPQTNLTDILGKKSSEIKTNGNNLANKPLAENDMSNLVNINDKNDNNNNISDNNNLTGQSDGKLNDIKVIPFFNVERKPKSPSENIVEMNNTNYRVPLGKNVKDAIFNATAANASSRPIPSDFINKKINPNITPSPFLSSLISGKNGMNAKAVRDDILSNVSNSEDTIGIPDVNTPEITEGELRYKRHLEKKKIKLEQLNKKYPPAQKVDHYRRVKGDEMKQQASSEVKNVIETQIPTQVLEDGLAVVDINELKRTMQNKIKNNAIQSMQQSFDKNDSKKLQKLRKSKPHTIIREVSLPNKGILFKELSSKMSIRAIDLKKRMVDLGELSEDVSKEKLEELFIDSDVAELVVLELGFKVNRVSAKEDADLKPSVKAQKLSQSLKPRAPVVSIMGHVDHGKTTLLDTLRQASVKVAGNEAGGITQKISAFNVSLSNGREVLFLDTPGHAAFTSMRSWSIQATDIVVLVVAIDDGVRPQTIEAIKQIKEAYFNCSVVIALNKVDKLVDAKDIATARLRVLTQLIEHGITAEDFGGESQVVEVSGKTGSGIDQLIEKISIQADIMELVAVDEGQVEAIVLNANIDKGRGVVVDLLIKWGSLLVGDYVVVGTSFGKVKAMLNDKGKKVKVATPSHSVQILGLRSMPIAGSELLSVKSEARAKEITERRIRVFELKKTQSENLMKQQLLEQELAEKALEDPNVIKPIPKPELKINMILKADGIGTLDALKNIVTSISERTNDIKIKIISHSVGDICRSDVERASTVSDTLILGFNVGIADSSTRSLAKELDVKIFQESIIYRLEDEIIRIMETSMPTERILTKELEIDLKVSTNDDNHIIGYVGQPISFKFSITIKRCSNYNNVTFYFNNYNNNNNNVILDNNNDNNNNNNNVDDFQMENVFTIRQLMFCESFAMSLCETDDWIYLGVNRKELIDEPLLQNTHNYIMKDNNNIRNSYNNDDNNSYYERDDILNNNCNIIIEYQFEAILLPVNTGKVTLPPLKIEFDSNNNNVNYDKSILYHESTSYDVMIIHPNELTGMRFVHIY
eukprot:gene13212-17709_t